MKSIYDFEHARGDSLRINTMLNAIPQKFISLKMLLKTPICCLCTVTLVQLCIYLGFILATNLVMDMIIWMLCC